MKRRWMKIGGGIAAAVITILGFFQLLAIVYGFQITDLTGDIVCKGTFVDPCVSDFDVRNPNAYNVDIYSKDQVKLDFSPEIRGYALFVKDGRCKTDSPACASPNGLWFAGWKYIDFTNKTKPRKDRVYNFRFPAYTTKHFRLAGLKINAKDTIKWGFSTQNKSLDPVWYGETDDGIIIRINPYRVNPLTRVKVTLDNGLKISNRGRSLTFRPRFIMESGAVYRWADIPPSIDKNLWKKEIASSPRRKIKYGADFNNVPNNIKNNLKYVYLKIVKAEKEVWSNITNQTEEVDMEISDVLKYVKIEGNSVILNDVIPISHSDILRTYNIVSINRSGVVIGGLDNSWFICYEYNETEPCINGSWNYNWKDNGDGTWNISFDPHLFTPLLKYFNIEENSTQDFSLISYIRNKIFKPIVIVITKAIHLDENNTVISDIYEDVKDKDDNWSDPVLPGQTVRITFEEPLDKTKDITIYARRTGIIINGTQVPLDVYEKKKRIDEIKELLGK